MKIFNFLILILILTSCNKPKTVFICGDHKCINKKEADHYFKENLTIEVKIIDKKTNKRFDLVELNLVENDKGEKKINLSKIKDTNKKLKILSKKEKASIRDKIRNKKNVNLENKIKENKEIVSRTNVNKKRKDVFDVCTKIKKCSIDEISKYLLKQGNKKDFPDITTRQ